MLSMLVPRSFKHVQRRPSDRVLSDEKGPMKANRSRTQSPKKIIPLDKQDVMAQQDERPRTPPIAVPQRKPSMPSMAVPQRSGLHGPATTQSTRIKGHHVDRPSTMPRNHRSDGVPPAVAALLAVTSIPLRPHRPSRKRTTPSDRKISIDELVEEWRKDNEKTPSFKNGSPMDVLLERTEDGENDDILSLDSGSEKESRTVSSRSISSDSLNSIPSLDADTQSLSSWGTANPATPQSMRREKSVSSPPKEDCVLDHPLLHYNLDEYSATIEIDESELANVSHKPVKARSSFKSNLTASLQALKSAAKSFSNFTAPSIPPEDLLTRSILYPGFTSEMRPKLSEGVPTAALRRYLNPLSPTELSMQIHETNDPSIYEAPMIQLQTYDRRGRSKGRRRGTVDPRADAGRALSSDPTVRQREPRENGDFLRVIVLEMNMRREGKLDTKAVGKARIWLPPRKTESTETVQLTKGFSIPSRWVGVGIDDV
ncbi:hypothetical protein EJ05DRAFT_17019 [Pseudovirgaria hyperparasitica]|uniref:Uncharacterized protein n=1 Tax=Pseudovirgaria hyperparasitica TaxID=470096 RepID=A0A6A6WKZ9_9PEZI|nr:uncharacterized protein EJ05DRAFT_17019 [Pseudovirgaria hyperparasitica]KAF2762843.1 hypothetical protein EJ05DRAFT_17019 [Pseudovirgaria hyperparasitica]